MKTFLQHPDNQTNPEWWRGATIYQIYPRSYQDSNGDGIGDLKGIIDRLPYIAGLGVDAVWLSPFFTSPMKDFGYDVSDYCDVDPMFGTLDDFKHLVAKAHELGLRVIIDQVLSHTADIHPWFVESSSSRDNPKADWYVWGDPKEDGSPPNNWLSIFIGSAWQWNARREQYYMHNFLTSQPDLNLHNREVRAALFDVLRFWLDIGVDGFRLDTVNFYMHDAQLRDNPARGRPSDNDCGVVPTNPYSWQKHLYDKSQPENLQLLQEMRAVLDEYPGITTVGELGDENSYELQLAYTADGDKLHTAYTFDLLSEQKSPLYLHEVLDKFAQGGEDSWACWSLGNHDTPRLATRWNGDPQALRAYLSMQLSLRGSPCLYQGEELGLTEGVLTFEQLRDPYGISMWPEAGGRDGCRTPMVWQADAANAGFSDAEPWLPVMQNHLPLAVDQQDTDLGSLLNYYRDWLQARRKLAVLWSGSFELLAAHSQVLAYIRRDAESGRTLLCVLNLSDKTAEYTLPARSVAKELADLPQTSDVGLLDKEVLSLQPWGTLFAWVD